VGTGAARRKAHSVPGGVGLTVAQKEGAIDQDGDVVATVDVGEG
jgi:hypothetical protein